MSAVDYLYPTSTKNVSDSFADHVARGSVNPGTDYTAPYGSEVRAVADGYVAGVVTTNYGSGGRMVYVDHDDQLGTDYLHLSLIASGIVEGKRVFRGDLLGYSGASGYGDDHYYGAHLHISIRNTHGYHAMNHGNFDFDKFIKDQAATAGSGGGTPIIQEEDDMSAHVYVQSNTPNSPTVSSKDWIIVTGAGFGKGFQEFTPAGGRADFVQFVNLYNDQAKKRNEPELKVDASDATPINDNQYQFIKIRWAA